MKNGRCRMHGGSSTGPRTEDGLARLRAARTRHGGYSAESQAALRREDTFIAETLALLALVSGGASPSDPIWPQALGLTGGVAPSHRKERRSG